MKIKFRKAYYRRWWIKNSWSDLGWFEIQPFYFIITILK